MAQLFTNNASTTLASAAGASDTALTVTDGSKFPSPSGSDYFLLTLASGSPETAWEIVKCTARSTNTLTVTRAQESTTAAAWPSGSIASLRLTAGSLEPLGGVAIGDGTTTRYLHDGSHAITRIDWRGTTTLTTSARTNLLTYSEQFDQSPWCVGRCTITANAAAAPDGTTTADLLSEDTTTNSHPVYQSLAGLSSGTTYSLSVYLKAGARSQVEIDLGSAAFATNFYGLYDLSLGTVTTGGGAIGSITAVGNGWYRCTLTATSVAAGLGTWYICPRLAGATSYLGTGATALYLWGAQFEAASTPTAYIPTTSSSASVTDYATASGVATLAVAPVAGAVLLGVAPRNPLLSDIGAAAASHTQAWSTISGTPTTLSGYGILDAASATPTATAYTVNAAPSTPSSGQMGFFAGTVAGRVMPAYIGPDTVSAFVQASLSRTRIAYWAAIGSNTTPSTIAFAATTTQGTATSRGTATTNLFTRARRIGYVSSATAGSLAGIYSTSICFYLGTGAGLGGFSLVTRFGCSDAAAVSGARQFVGLASSVVAATNVEPSTLTNIVGIGHGASDTNLKIYYGGSAAQTPIDLGANFPANTLSTNLYELVLFSSSYGTGIGYRVTLLGTSYSTEGTITNTTPGTTLPATTTGLGFRAWRSNNATALAAGIDLSTIYLETDNG